LDAYAADIFLMKVLVLPVDYGQPVTPKKRKFHKSDPMTLDICNGFMRDPFPYFSPSALNLVLL
jgi:hypothetical protein